MKSFKRDLEQENKRRKREWLEMNQRRYCSSRMINWFSKTPKCKSILWGWNLAKKRSVILTCVFQQKEIGPFCPRKPNKSRGLCPHCTTRNLLMDKVSFLKMAPLWVLIWFALHQVHANVSLSSSCQTLAFYNPFNKRLSILNSKVSQRLISMLRTLKWWQCITQFQKK